MRKLPTFALAACLTLTAVACGGSDDDADGAAASSAEGTGGAAASGEWSFTDDNGNTVTLDVAPDTIVAQSTIAGGLWEYGVEVEGVFGPLRRANGEPDPAIGLVTGHFETFDELEGAFRFESCEFPGLLVHNRAIEPSIFRREGWLRVGGYSSTFSAPGIEDWDLWIRLVELGYRAEVIPETVWDYRVRSDQMSTGMYRPDTWARLFRELVDRHADAYREHMVAVMSMQAERWAELRRWSNELMAATGWWERQAGNWERLAGQGEALRLEQQARIAALEHARDAHQRETGNAT